MISRWKDIKASREIGVVVAVVEVGGPDIPDTRCYGGSSGRIGEGRLGFLGRGMNNSWVRVQEHRPGASTHRRARRDGFPF